MSCILLDIELADKNVIKELGVFLWQSSRTLISSSNEAQTHKTSVLVRIKFARNGVEHWTFGLQGEYFAKRNRKKQHSWVILLDEKVKKIGRSRLSQSSRSR